MKRLITGIQSTGSIHVGNYFGAIRQGVALQEKYECYMFIADLHALNQVFDAEALRGSIMEIAKAYLAVGADPEKVCLFRQSQVPQHAELAVILSNSTGMGMLERSHAYKDAVAKGNKKINAGLFYYPILMASDILLYQADVVPVGEDQKQHLEMAREIAERFNHAYGKTFTMPQGVHGEDVPTVKGLDGRKMSKSYGNVIGLFDSAEEVQKKVMRIVTDSKLPNETKSTDDTIFSLYRLVATPDQIAEMQEAYTKGGIGYKEAKERLASALNLFLEPIRAKKSELDANEDYVNDVLRSGANAAKIIAEATLESVRGKIGLS